MEKTPTISDVARLAGVSVATASRTLTHARRVDPRLQARVLAAADELSYAPNPHARALAQATDASVGVVVHDIGDPYFSEIVSGMLGAAADSDRLVVFCNTYRDSERELAYVRQFRAQRVQALVLAGSSREDREFGAAMAEQILGFGAAGGRALAAALAEMATVSSASSPGRSSSPPPSTAWPGSAEASRWRGSS